MHGWYQFQLSGNHASTILSLLSVSAHVFHSGVFPIKDSTLSIYSPACLYHIISLLSVSAHIFHSCFYPIKGSILSIYPPACLYHYISVVHVSPHIS